MYHIGKVIMVFSQKDKNVEGADSSVQAMVNMWDENMIVIEVEARLAEKIKKEDIVLVDYSPMFPSGQPVPKMSITKILRGETGKKALNEYETLYKKRKKEIKNTGIGVREQQSYVR